MLLKFDETGHQSCCSLHSVCALFTTLYPQHLAVSSNCVLHWSNIEKEDIPLQPSVSLSPSHPSPCTGDGLRKGNPAHMVLLTQVLKRGMWMGTSLKFPPDWFLDNKDPGWINMSLVTISQESLKSSLVTILTGLMA